jgi:hypothetical protein
LSDSRSDSHLAEYISQGTARAPIVVSDSEEGNVNTFVIGVGGASGSGKSTLAESLVRLFGSHFSVVMQDNFVSSKKGFNAILPAGHRIWGLRLPIHTEEITLHIDHCIRAAISGEHESVPRTHWMRQPLRPEQGRGSDARGKSSGKAWSEVIVVEGGFIFACAELVNRLDLALWIETPQDIVFQQLLKRSKKRAADKEEFSKYFLSVKWPNHVKWRGVQLRKAGDRNILCILDGCLDKVKLLEYAARVVTDRIGKESEQQESFTDPRATAVVGGKASAMCATLEQALGYCG